MGFQATSFMVCRSTGVQWIHVQIASLIVQMHRSTIFLRFVCVQCMEDILTQTSELRYPYLELMIWLGIFYYYSKPCIRGLV